jgi:ubiquinone/menaquinone biosynthesis C-methylase UbiE
MESAGFTDVTWRRFMGGVTAVHAGQRSMVDSRPLTVDR